MYSNFFGDIYRFSEIDCHSRVNEMKTVNEIMQY